MAAEIVIEVKKDGSTQISVQGVAGPSCTDLTKAMEEALGEVASRECTLEMYQEASEVNQLKQ